MVVKLVIDRSRQPQCLLLLTCEIDKLLFFGDKILHLESDFRKLGSVAVLRSFIRILRTSFAQIDTVMAEKHAKLADKFAKLYARLQSSVAYTI